MLSSRRAVSMGRLDAYAGPCRFNTPELGTGQNLGQLVLCIRLLRQVFSVSVTPLFARIDGLHPCVERAGFAKRCLPFWPVPSPVAILR